MNKEELHLYTIEMAETILSLRCSLRKCAEIWDVPKSTVQYRMSVILPKIAPEYYRCVIEILDEHNSILISQTKHPERWTKGVTNNETTNLS